MARGETQCNRRIAGGTILCRALTVLFSLVLSDCATAGDVRALTCGYAMQCGYRTNALLSRRRLKCRLRHVCRHTVSPGPAARIHWTRRSYWLTRLIIVRQCHVARFAAHSPRRACSDRAPGSAVRDCPQWTVRRVSGTSRRPCTATVVPVGTRCRGVAPFVNGSATGQRAALMSL